MFFIRIDIDAENNRLGTTMRLVEKTSPVFLGTVKTVLADDNGVAEEEEEVQEGGERPMRAGDEGSDSAASYFQRHPRELLKRLFG
nr:MAG: wsv136-like protein [Hemigrapsus takanoi nimavirus]